MYSSEIWLFLIILHFSRTVGNIPPSSHIVINKLYSESNFRKEKSAAESVLINFYSFYNFHRLWEFFMLSPYPYLNLAIAKSIFNQEKWQAECVSISFYFLSNFHIFEGLWEFFKPSSRPCHPFALFFFKLSHMPDHAGKWHWAVPQQRRPRCKHWWFRFGVGQLPKAPGNCPPRCINIKWQLPICHAW